jgi:succinate dehydrogenase (ubiquinone) cytochrome b560 subunit
MCCNGPASLQPLPFYSFTIFLFYIQNYTDRMKKTGRPVSPHVTVYAFPAAAISSITNRVTGCALSVGAAGLGAAELLGGSGTSLQLMQMIGQQSPWMVASAKFCVAFPCTYHYFGAVRHLLWDAKPELLSTNEEVEKSAYILFGSSLAVSGILMIM